MERLRQRLSRIPRHIGVIPDGNRRWAEDRGLPRQAGYDAGIDPGLRLLQTCRELGIEEVSAYGFTKENVRRPTEQILSFRKACVDLALRAAEEGAALLAVGDTSTDQFPAELLPYARERGPGDIKFNLLVNYGWQWDLYTAMKKARSNGAMTYSQTPTALGSAGVSRIELVIRWGGFRRLSGFLPMQCAYADFYVIDTLWPEMEPEEFIQALEWYQGQEVTMGG